MFTSGVLLQLLGCALYQNWWPMLTGLMYVLVPMPYLFFGAGGSGGGYSSYSGGGGGGWTDAGKFLTGFSAVGSIAIPAILAHAQVRCDAPCGVVRERLCGSARSTACLDAQLGGARRWEWSRAFLEDGVGGWVA